MDNLIKIYLFKLLIIININFLKKNIHNNNLLHI